MAKNTDARLRANTKWDKENTTSFTVKMKNGKYKPLQDYLESNNDISRNAFVIEAIEEKLNRISNNTQKTN